MTAAIYAAEQPFMRRVVAGFFNATSVGGSGTLSDVGATVYGLSAPSQIRGNTVISGKKAVAIRCDAIGAALATALVGITDGVAANVGPGGDGHSVGLGSDGMIYAAGLPLSGGAGAAYGLGGVVGLLVDMTNKLLWFSKDGITFWGGDFLTYTIAQVAAGVGGITFGLMIPGATAYAAVGCVSNAGKAFTAVPWPAAMAIPAGFSAL